MAVDLQTLENIVLANTQQSQLVNFGGAPNWASAVNPQLPQTLVDWAINRAYQRLMGDLADIELYLYTSTISSTANTADYNLPLNVGDPPVDRLMRVFYKPAGEPYTLELEPGVRLVSWKQFQRYTAAGYLKPFYYGTQPDYVTVTPDRKTLSFYPGSANVGDTITIKYVPIITAGTSVAPLVNETDTVVLPDDTELAIGFYATALVSPKLAQHGMMQEYMQLYNAELARLRERYAMTSRGDTQRLTDRDEGLLTSQAVGSVLYLP